MTDAPLVSYSRNGEDVVLLRALGGVAGGRFLELREAGAGDPTAMRNFLDRGWTGAVADVAQLADPAAIDRQVDTLGEGELHVVLVAADLAPSVLERVPALARHRPWVLVVGMRPDDERDTFTASMQAAGYLFCLFDGVSAYFVAAARVADLREALSYPACARDGHVSRRAAEQVEAARRAEAQALESALRWREKAVQSWADNSTGGIAAREELRQLREHADDLANHVTRLQRTVSWRVTAPLRRVRRLRSGAPR